MSAALAVLAGASLVGNSYSQSRADGYQGADKILIPTSAWPCGMPEGIPVPERGVPVFTATVQIDQIYDLGRTPYGRRQVLVLREGTITGDKLNGTVMTGGLDFQLSFSNRAMEIEQVFVLRASDGKYIYVHVAGTAADQTDVRVVPDFEAPNAGSNNWLNSGKYAARRVVDTAAKTMKLTVFDVSGIAVATDGKNSLHITKPGDVLDQPTGPRRAAAGETRGEQLIVEQVTLAGSQSVGATKNGVRNIIPITGGSLSGKIAGKILFGGADYQKLSNPATLDARYLWQTAEGDVLIVHNAGPINSLVPTFEVSLDSKYAFLNRGKYLSSSPGMGAGGVSLTFFESKE